MEIKCKVSFTLPEELVDALELTEDTPIIASVSGNRITLEFADDEFEDTEDDLSDDDEDDCDGNCEYCEYFCPHCGECVLD
mgnify:FL=1